MCRPPSGSSPLCPVLVRTPLPFSGPFTSRIAGTYSEPFLTPVLLGRGFIALPAENMGKRSPTTKPDLTPSRPQCRAASGSTLAFVGLLGRLGTAAVPYHGTSDLRDRRAGAHFTATARHWRPLLRVRGPDPSGDRSRLLRARARSRHPGSDGPARVFRGKTRSGDPLPGPRHEATDPLPPSDRARVAPLPRVESEGPAPRSYWAASFARHLCRINPGCTRVALYMQYHQMPDPGSVVRGIARGEIPVLDGPSLYTTAELIGAFSCNDF